MVISELRTLTRFSECRPYFHPLLSYVTGVRNITYRFNSTNKMPPNAEAHLQCKPGTDIFKLMFRYVNPEINVNREFKVNRSIHEQLNSLIPRMMMKINAAPKQKAKKLRQPSENSEVGQPSENSEVNITPMIPIEFIRNNQPVPDNVRCKDLFKEFGKADVILKIGEVSYDIFVNYPWIQNMALPKSMMVGFNIYPCKFDAYFVDDNASEFVWYKDGENEPIGSGFIYVPTINDIGSELKLICTPVGHGVKGIPFEVTSSCDVEAGPGRCPFEDRHVFTSERPCANAFRVISYNILSDLYASSVSGKSIFSYCPPYALKMDYRKQLLIKELIGYNADLICMQEVDCGIFEKDFKPVLRTVDMDGLLAKKGAQVNEGVACFYRRSRFELVSSCNAILSESCCNKPCLEDIWKIVSKNEALSTQITDRTTVLQLVILRYIDKPNHKVVVANTHLYFRPDADNIRLLQTGMSINLINDLVARLKSENPDDVVSVIFCGDFNSTPECGVYQLMTTNHIPENHKEWNNGETTISNLSLKSPFNFASACGTPEFTNYTVGFKECLDYIFYQTDLLKVEQVIPFPSVEEVSRFNAIPSPIFPSDHVALVADLAWK